jgi:hypothetical protein
LKKYAIVAKKNNQKSVLFVKFITFDSYFFSCIKFHLFIFINLILWLLIFISNTSSYLWCFEFDTQCFNLYFRFLILLSNFNLFLISSRGLLFYFYFYFLYIFGLHFLDFYFCFGFFMNFIFLFDFAIQFNIWRYLRFNPRYFDF